MKRAFAGMIRAAWNWVVLLFQRPERGAALFSVLFGTLTLILGSAGTVWLFAGTGYALIMMVRGKLPVALHGPILAACLICLGYFVSSVISPLFFPNALKGWRDVGTCLQFLAFVPLVLAMAQTARVDVFDLCLWGLRIGAVLSFVLALVQVVLLDQVRAKGGMANPIPFSNIALLAGAMAFIGLDRLSPRDKAIAVVAGFCGLGACLLSQTRGALLALPLILVVLLVLNRRLIASRWKESIGFLGMLTVGFVLLFAFARLPERFEILVRGLESQTSLMHGDPSTSHRAILWTYGARAMAERPLGYGSQNAVDEVRRIAARDGYEVPPYNHLHNEFVTTGVGRGIIGLLALIAVLLGPVILAWRSARDHRFGERAAFAVILCGGYLIFGLTNVLFSHDQLSSFFISSLVILMVAIDQAASRTTFTPSWPLLLSPDRRPA